MIDFEQKRERNRRERHRQIRQWAEYVRTHDDDEWGPQVNKIVNSQLESARHHEDDRPDVEALRESARPDEGDQRE